MTTKAPSSALAEFERARETTYAALRKIQRRRTDWDEALRAEIADYSAFVDSHPEHWRDEARNPKPGSESEKKLAAIRDKQAAGNPHESDYVEARGKFHDADTALATFLRRALPELIAEDEPAHQAVIDKLREAFDLIVEAGNDYAALLAGAQQLVNRTPGVTGRALTYDHRPNEWRKLAAGALDEPLAPPGLTELGLWKLSDR